MKNRSRRLLALLLSAVLVCSCSVGIAFAVTAVINFLLIALVIFSVIKAMNKFNKKKEEEPDPTTKKCPFCQSDIDIKATRCPHCTSELEK